MSFRGTATPRDVVCSKEGIGETAATAGGEQGVTQQADDCHRSDAARYRRDRTGDFAHRVKIDVAENAAAAVGNAAGLMPTSMTVAPA